MQKKVFPLIAVLKKSTLAEIKESSGKPKSVVSLLHNAAGGITGAMSASELPRNRHQIYNSQHSSACIKKCSDKADPIFELVQQCKIDLMPGGRKFIRCVNFDTSPSCVLATDSQLKNLLRFCTSPGDSLFWGLIPHLISVNFV